MPVLSPAKFPAPEMALNAPPSANTIVTLEQIHAFLRGKSDPSVPDEPNQIDAKEGETPL